MSSRRGDSFGDLRLNTTTTTTTTTIEADDELCLSATDSAFGRDESESKGDDVSLIEPPTTYLKTQTKPDATATLPFEVAVQIVVAAAASPKSIASVASLNRKWAAAANDNLVWKAAFVAKFGGEKLRTVAEKLAGNWAKTRTPFVVHAEKEPCDPRVFHWDPLIDRNNSNMDLDGGTTPGAPTLQTSLDYSNRRDPLPPPPPLPAVFHTATSSVTSSSGSLSSQHYDLNWKEIFRQRMILYNNWKHGNYSVRSFTGHLDAVYCIQFAGDLLVSGSRDRSLKFWDIESIHCLRTLTGHEGSILCMQHDSTKYIVTGSSDSTAIVWDYVTGNIIRRLLGHALPVLDIRFDSTRIVTCSKDCTLKVWDLASGAMLYSLEGHQAAVNAVHMHGDQVVSASGDCVVKLWNLNTGTLVRTFVGHTRGLACVQFDGKVILSGSNDFTIKIWDAATGVCLRTLEGHSNLVRTLCFDDERIVSGSYDNTIRIWDRATGECMHILEGVHNSWVFHVQMDAWRIVSSAQDKRIAVWEFGRNCRLLKAFS